MPSVSDDLMTEYAGYGYGVGSLSDREYAWLTATPQSYTVPNLSMGDMRYAMGLGGSATQPTKLDSYPNYLRASTGAESGLTGWDGLGTGTLSQESTGALYGTKCFKLVCGAGATSNMRINSAYRTPVSAGKLYSLSVSAKWVTGTPKLVRIDVWFYDADGNTTEINNGQARDISNLAWNGIVNNDNLAPTNTVFADARLAFVDGVAGDAVLTDGWHLYTGNRDPAPTYVAGAIA